MELTDREPNDREKAAAQRRERIEGMREAQQVEPWVRAFRARERERIVRSLEAMEQPDPETLIERQRDLRWLKRLERDVEDAIRAGKRAMEETV